MSTAPERIATRVEGLLGAHRVVATPDELAHYAIGGMQPAAALRPATPEEVCEVVRFARTERLAIVPCGSATKFAMGTLPARYDLALDVSSLDQIAHYDPGDLTVSADAGVPLTALQARLAAHGQFVPLEVPYFERGTLGGAIASGMDSPLRELYGTSRDFLIGAEFVTGTGEKGRSGGRVVKNVTGYDLHKLLIGSLGTLAVVTRLNFRTFPLPRESRTFCTAFASVEDAVRFLQTVRNSPLMPSFLELFPASTAALLHSAAFVAHPWTICAGINGDEAVCARHERDLQSMAEASRAQSVAVWRGGDNLRARSTIREALPALWNAGGGRGAILKITTGAANAVRFAGQLLNCALPQDTELAMLVRSCGVIYAAVLLTHEAGDAHAVTTTVAATSSVIAMCVGNSASATLLFAAPELRTALRSNEPHRLDLALMRRIKSAFDPDGIFAPGSFAGGI
jgi:glycolate oxidase FAD binding subunit